MLIKKTWIVGLNFIRVWVAFGFRKLRKRVAFGASHVVGRPGFFFHFGTAVVRPWRTSPRRECPWG